ncbi:MAG: M48 family metalloprotease [Phycisphaerales bacterium]|nr:M48 family metalloprotease [Phycisphaerales bacterium]
MLYVCLIVAFGSIILRDQAGPRPPFASLGLSVEPGLSLWLVPALHAFLALVVHAASRRAAARIERTNRLTPVEELDSVIAASRIAGAMLTAASVVMFGFLDAIRSVTGDLILVDESLALAPFLLLVVTGWWSSYPVERTVRDSTLIRDLDEGRPIYTPPSRGAYVWAQTRHQLFILLVPMVLLTLWGESVEQLVSLAQTQAEAQATDGVHRLLAPIGRFFAARSTTAELVYLAVKLAGLLLIVAAAPLLIRRVWDTVPLQSGSVADGLLRMCRQQGVKVRRLLVWRTGGTMINGAVLGVVGGARYILLTDALLDFLPNHYVQAVMAHEIGHVRCRHVPWLTATLFAASGVSLVAADLVLRWLLGVTINQVASPIQVSACAAALAVAVGAFGYVSRRFEWQADAFAVKHISAHTPPTDDPAAAWAPSATVTRPAIAAMTGALETVAVANHLPRDRFTFRHGSIRTRIDRLLALDGVPLARLPIDRSAARLKLAVAVGSVLVLAAAFGL